MTGSGRLLTSLRRGVLAVAANPALILAPFVLAVATLVGVLAGLGALLVPIVSLVTQGFGWLRQGDREQLRKLPARILEALLLSPVLLVLSALVVLAVMVLLTILASYLNAGTAAVLVAADERAPAGIPARSEFRVDVIDIFRRRGRELFGRFFGLLNLYGLAVVVLIGLMFLACVVMVVGVLQGKLAVGLLLVFVTVPVVLVGSVVARLVNLAASRSRAAPESSVRSVLDSVASGLEDLRRTAGATAGLFLIWVAGTLSVAAIFSVPRLLLGFVLFDESGPRFGAIAADVILVLTEWLVFGFLQLAMTGSFFSLWNPGRAARSVDPARPPVAFMPGIASAPSALHEELP